MNLMQNTPEWHDFRKDKIGASDAPIIMGVSPWKTPYQLWCEKLGLAEQQEQNEYMKRGSEMEPHVRLELYLQKGILVKPEVTIHPEFPWMIASLDGIDADRKIAVEIKCPGEKDHRLALDGMIPEKYFPQLQHQLAVTGLPSILYVSYREDHLVVVDVTRDDKYISSLIDLELNFLECILNKMPPYLTEKDYILRDDDIWIETARKWMDTQKKIFELEKEEKELRQHLTDMAQNKNCRGAGIRIIKVHRKGNIDYSKIPELENVDLEKYRKEDINFWKICSDE